MATLDEAFDAVLSALVQIPRDSEGNSGSDGQELLRLTKLGPDEINDAVAVLVNNGWAKWLRPGLSPWQFAAVVLTPFGRAEHRRLRAAPKANQAGSVYHIGRIEHFSGVLGNVSGPVTLSATQTDVASPHVVEAVGAILNQVREILAAGVLDQDREQAVQREISIVDGEIRAAAPMASVIRSSLASVHRILEGAAATVIGTAAATSLTPLIHAISNLLH